ncbi:adenine-specific methyltransferase EcoRI family protein [Ancylomarina sp. YFZ004]
MANINLTAAKRAKNDEFYTQYSDIQKEIQAYLDYNPDVFKGKTILLPCDDPEWSNFTKFFAQNFEHFGLKKLISTSFAVDSKPYKAGYQTTLFEVNAPQYDSNKTKTNGKIFTLTHDVSGNGKIDVDDLEWEYLEGDGDFKSEEVKALRDEADIIITNPPFSLFREFLVWIMEANKLFAIIGNINAITYKEVFPPIKDNNIWLGTGMGRWISGFIVPESYELYGTEARIDSDGNRIIATNNCLWLTNIEHGKRHQPLKLMSMADNRRFNKKLQKKAAYEQYDNYDAIEVPFSDAIPLDYDGVMGVPISFLDKYCPEQFEIVGSDSSVKEGLLPDLVNSEWKGKLDRGYINNKRFYSRILIKRKN